MQLLWRWVQFYDLWEICFWPKPVGIKQVSLNVISIAISTIYWPAHGTSFCVVTAQGLPGRYLGTTQPKRNGHIQDRRKQNISWLGSHDKSKVFISNINPEEHFMYYCFDIPAYSTSILNGLNRRHSGPPQNHSILWFSPRSECHKTTHNLKNILCSIH